MLTIEQQISKLNSADELAHKAASSQDIAARLGAVVLFAGMVDFSVIQAARLVEQLVLKGQLASGVLPTFKPSEDSYFYSHKVSTEKMLKGIRKLLPFNANSDVDSSVTKRVNSAALEMVDTAYAFLNYRNPLLHQIGNPKHTFEDVLKLADGAIEAYERFVLAHRVFCECAAPFRFGPEEIKYFYEPAP